MRNRWYGFNLLPMFIKGLSAPQKEDMYAMDFMAEEGFNFVRLPMDYRLWTEEFNYCNPNEEILNNVLDRYISEANTRGLHISINLHRAPGYCINRNDLERHNLWTDKEAQEGFVCMWKYFAQRYRDIPAENLSFDLLNEPPNIGQYSFTRQIHSEIMRDVLDAVREVDSDRIIFLNGVGCGHLAIPELADTNTIHSGRGYTPIGVSHYKAEWMEGSDSFPQPSWPYTDEYNKEWNKDTLKEFYRPWREVQETGTDVFIGEFGCYNKTPNEIALAWLSDLLSIYHEYGWGFALWNFYGPFGIADHERDGAILEKYKGFMIDRKILDVLKSNMTNI